MGVIDECERFNYETYLCDNPVYDTGVCKYYNKETKECEIDVAIW